MSHTFGNVGLMLAMMTGGLWVIANPLGTVGVLASWANEGRRALAAGSGGKTMATSGGLTQDVRGLFAMTVDGPWCYLEFGDVAWCKERVRLIPPRGPRGSGLPLLRCCSDVWRTGLGFAHPLVDAPCCAARAHTRGHSAPRSPDHATCSFAAAEQPSSELDQ